MNQGRPTRAERRQLGEGVHFITGHAKDGTTQERIDQIVRDGYVILPSIFTACEIAEANAEAAHLEALAAGPASQGGRNAFEGFKTNRIYALADKSRVFDKFVLHPDILALNDYFLEEGYLLSTYLTVTVRPGGESQQLHNDDQFIGHPRPRPLFSTGLMVSLDDFTADNGATVVIPGSHLWSDERIPLREQTIPITMPAGSAVFFLAPVYHGAGNNKTDKQRRSLALQYCQPWLRQTENMMIAVQPEDLNEIPKRLRDMLGYRVHQPFIGYVDGSSPRKGVEKMRQRISDRAKGISRL
ncbi:MAG: hypothetical protein M1827_004278 [Pycnora praestabilis]|nr:MAG: hypothetical protein M1827_004278 [Pycnora praestabilis]